jgi:hypothetical protein
MTGVNSSGRPPPDGCNAPKDLVGRAGKNRRFHYVAGNESRREAIAGQRNSAAWKLQQKPGTPWV